MSVLSSPPQESIVDALHKLRDAVIIAVAAVVITVAGASYFVVHTEKTGGKTLSKIGGISDQLTGKLADKDATIKAKDATIKAKDAQITELGTQVLNRDSAINSQTAIIGQLYNGAVALQQQVTALGGQAKTLPITIPGVSSTTAPGAATRPKATVTGPQPNPPPPPAAPVPRSSTSPAVNLQVQCPVICPPTH